MTEKKSRRAAVVTGSLHRSKNGNVQSGSGKKGTVALRIAESMGLLAGPKTHHVNAKVSPILFEAAAKRIGTRSPAAVMNAALAALATEDELGPWLARNWGVLSDIDPELLNQIDF